MSKNATLRDEIKSQNKKLKDMTLKQKSDYIWQYYKIHILGTLIAILSIILILIMFNNNNYKTVFNTVVVDGYMTGLSDHTDAMTTGFTEYIGVDGQKERVIFSNNFSFIQKELDQDAYYSIANIVAMVTAGTLDGLLCDYEYIDFFSTDDELFLTDLTELFTSNELAKISDYLVYYTAADGSTTPIAVDLTSTHIKTETDLYMNQPCFGITVTAPNRDNAVKFIKYAFGL